MYVHWRPPLGQAVKAGNIEAAATLLKAQAPVEGSGSPTHTPLREAIECLNFDVAELLIRHRANPSIGNHNLGTPFASDCASIFPGTLSIMLLGDTCVGKSSLLDSYVCDIDLYSFYE
jgi:ankyrin repeat protein